MTFEVPEIDSASILAFRTGATEYAPRPLIEALDDPGPYVARPGYVMACGRRQIEAVLRYRGVDFHVLVTHLPGAQRILFHYNAALTPGHDGSPVYQRASWVNDIDAHVVNFTDPTVHQHPEMVLGWGQGSPDHYYTLTVAGMATVVADMLALPDGARHLHFGTSAGGYQAIAAGALDPGSKAMVNNPQIDWTRHFWGKSVTLLSEEVFHRSAEDLAAE